MNTFTYDARARRFRQAGRFTDADTVITNDGAEFAADQALELRHTRGSRACGGLAGAVSGTWLRQMHETAMKQPCLVCSANVGLGDVEISDEQSRDWSEDS